jgi:hypothetical protein
MTSIYIKKIRLSTPISTVTGVGGVTNNYQIDGLDSAAAINLIDSAYVQARQLDATPADGIDSDAVIGIIDSDYVSSRVTISESRYRF